VEIAAARKKIYDEKKVQKVYGVTLLLFGILTGLDMVIKSFVYDIIYLVVVIANFCDLSGYCAQEMSEIKNSKNQ